MAMVCLEIMLVAQLAALKSTPTRRLGFFSRTGLLLLYNFFKNTFSGKPNINIVHQM